MQELFNQIDQGLYDLFFAILMVAALVMCIPVRREERDNDRERL